MRATIEIPETGAGPITRILSLEDAAETAPLTGFQFIEIDAPGIPTDRLHWDGTAVVDGPYVSPEEIAARDAQTAVDSAQDAVDATMADYLDKLSGFLLGRFTVPQSDFDFISAATTIEDVKTSLTGILNKIALSQGEIDFLNDFQTKYATWVVAKANL